MDSLRSLALQALLFGLTGVATVTQSLSIPAFGTALSSSTLQSHDLGVVISPGGWHTPPLYDNLVQALVQRGVEAATPLMPTTNITTADVTDPSNPIFNMAEPPEGWPTVYDDAKAVGNAVHSMINRGKKVLIIGHSMGGFAATQAAIPEYQIQNRRKEGLPGGVIGLFYFGAFLPPVGIAVNEMVGEDVVPPYALLHVSLRVVMLFSCPSPNKSISRLMERED